ncbi:MAG: hypothetical protein IPP74_12105 [Alphaproteobacteria bacterium]|nr:hypothetical protein [Alphaproteobacteria bacterium]
MIKLGNNITHHIRNVFNSIQRYLNIQMIMLIDQDFLNLVHIAVNAIQLVIGCRLACYGDGSCTDSGVGDADFSVIFYL